jgi:ribosome-interacting GTPase 1
MTVLGLIDRIDEDGTIAAVCKNISKDLLSKFKNFVFWD